MFEKTPHTPESMLEKMNRRYGDAHQHKHNINHMLYRKLFRSRPRGDGVEIDQPIPESGAKGLLRKFKWRKIRKRLDKGHFH